VLPALTVHWAGILFLCILSMIILWFMYLKSDTATWVDVGWSFNFTLVVLYFMIAYRAYTPAALGLAFMYLLWSLRLSGHLLARLNASGEDHRYEALKNSWGSQARIKFLGFFIFQGVLNLVFCLPLFILWSDSGAEFNGLRKIATLLWLVSTWSEGRADRQLERFKRDPKNIGKTCREGFWKFSRHPNYFFEFMIWVAFALYSLTSPMGYLAVLCPALIILFLFKITGIPANENQAAKSRGADYKRYQETTSVFFPWFPKATHDKNSK